MENSDKFQTGIISMCYVLVTNTHCGPARFLCGGDICQPVLRKAIDDIWGPPKRGQEHQIKIIALSEAELLTRLVKESITYLVEIEGSIPADRSRYLLIGGNLAENDLIVQVQRHLRNRSIGNHFKLYNLTAAVKITAAAGVLSTETP